MRHRVFHHVWPVLLVLGAVVCADGPSFSSTAVGQEVKKEPGQKNIDAEVARLLAKLKEQQDDRLSGQDVWARTMKELIELGPDATPLLSRADRDSDGRPTHAAIDSIRFAGYWRSACCPGADLDTAEMQRLGWQRHGLQLGRSRNLGLHAEA